MEITIHRGTKEIGGSLIELSSKNTRILIDAGLPLASDNKLAKDNFYIKDLINRINSRIDAVLISHAHLDHYGLIQNIRNIPVFLSKGTMKLIELSGLFSMGPSLLNNFQLFSMYKPFLIGNLRIMPFLMDHSAFDAAAFEISDGSRTIIYTGDFRGHGRKSKSFERFLNKARKNIDALLIEGTLLERPENKVLTEEELENQIVLKTINQTGPILFQTSSQNIDRLVSFYKIALRLKKLFVIDLYTANILYDLRQLGNNLPYPSAQYSNIRVFYSYGLMRKIYNTIGEKYAIRFRSYYISKEKINREQNNIVMIIRPSMIRDLKAIKVKNGIFLYSLWHGYRDNKIQKQLENYLVCDANFTTYMFHTSGHAYIPDIKKVINRLKPKQIVPIHTSCPEQFLTLSNKVALKEDGVSFNI